MQWIAVNPDSTGQSVKYLWNIQPCPQSSENAAEKGKRDKRLRAETVEDQDGHGRTAVLVNGQQLRLLTNHQASQHSIMEGEGAHESPSLAEELLRAECYMEGEGSIL